MGFLNPFLLFGTLASLIPLLIHLWSRRQAKTVDFSSLRFLLAAHRKSVRRLQIRQWLILLLRMLIVGLLAMAFARPLLRSQFSIAGTRIHTSCVIVLDNSYSMQYEGIMGNYFELAQQQAVQIAETLQRGDRGSLVLMSNKVDIVFPNLTTDLAQLAQAIRTAQVSQRSTSVRQGLEAAYRLLEMSDDPNKEIYLITDLTKNAWENWDKDLIHPGSRLFLVPIGELNPSNMSIEEISQPNPLTGIGLPTRIEVQVSNHGQGHEQTMLSFTMDGRKIEEVGLSLAPNETLTHTILHEFMTPGVHVGYASLQGDRLPVDDRYYFTVHVAGSVRVLCVGEDLPYLALALNPDGVSSPTQPYLFLPVVITSDKFTETVLDDYDMVTIGDLSQLPTSSLLKLSGYVQNGGKLLVFLGNQQSQANLAPLLDLQIGSIETFDSPRQFHISEPQLDLFAATSVSYLASSDAPRFYRAYDINIPRGPQDDIRIVAYLGDDQTTPGILLSAGGSILVFNTSLQRDWSTLPLNPSFVALIQQACLGFENQGAEIVDRHVGVPRPFSLPRAEGGRVNLLHIESEEIETLLLQPDRTSAPFTPDEAGIYELNYTSDGAVQHRYVAVNVESTESNLERYSVEQMMKLLDGAHLLSETQKLRDELSHYRTGREIWGHLILLSMLLMMLELYLANRRRSSV